MASTACAVRTDARFVEAELAERSPLLAPGCHVPRGRDFCRQGSSRALLSSSGCSAVCSGRFCCEEREPSAFRPQKRTADGARCSTPHQRHFCSSGARGAARLLPSPRLGAGRGRRGGAGPGRSSRPAVPLRPPPRSPRSAGRLCKMAAAAERGAGLPAEPPPPPPRGVRPPPPGPEEAARRLAVTRRELSNRRKILLRNLPAESSSQVRPPPAAGREAEGLLPRSAAATKSSPEAPLGFSRRFVAVRGGGSGRLREPHRCERAGWARGCAGRQRRSASRVWRCGGAAGGGGFPEPESSAPVICALWNDGELLNRCCERGCASAPAAAGRHRSEPRCGTGCPPFG